MAAFNAARLFDHRPWTSAIVGFSLFLAAFLANGRALPEIDCVAAPYMAWSMVRHGDWNLRDYPEMRRLLIGPVRQRPDGGWYSMRPPGSAIAAIPFVAPLALVQARPSSELGTYLIGKLAAAVCVAAGAMFLFGALRRLGPTAALPATILFGLGTSAYSTASQALWMHGPALFWLCGALYVLTRADAERPPWRAAAGFALGMAVLTRPATAFFALATVGVMLARRDWRGSAALALGGVLPGLILIHYNVVHFGNGLLGGYEDDNWAGSPPLWLGLGGLLVAPSRGLFVYSPALLVALPGVKALMDATETPLKATRSLLFAWLAAALVSLLFYARWHDWAGGWSFGPRLLCETMPIACVFFALGYERLARGWPRWAATAAVALSVGIQILGVVGHDAFPAWQDRHALADQGRSLFSFHDTQIEAHARATLARFQAHERGLAFRLKALAAPQAPK